MIKKDIDYYETLDPLGNLNNLSLSTEDCLKESSMDERPCIK